MWLKCFLEDRLDSTPSRPFCQAALPLDCAERVTRAGSLEVLKFCRGLEGDAAPCVDVSVALGVDSGEVAVVLRIDYVKVDEVDEVECCVGS